MRRWRIALILAACFLFRLCFGLSREFFFEDETQIFLLGFRYYATGAWPFFGPDVVWTRSEIPGALQALLVGLPLRMLAIPESPFVLLNLLSFAAICALAWYACAPAAAGAALADLGMVPHHARGRSQFSAHMINTSYILAPAIVFFIGFFEATPRLQPAAAAAGRAAFAMMGFAIDLADADPHVVAAAAAVRRGRVDQPAIATARARWRSTRRHSPRPR